MGGRGGRGIRTDHRVIVLVGVLTNSQLRSEKFVIYTCRVGWKILNKVSTECVCIQVSDLLVQIASCYRNARAFTFCMQYSGRKEALV